MLAELIGPLSISDFTAWFGWLAAILLAANFALGILQPLRYDTVTRWPHRRLPVSLFRLHKWIGYTAIFVVIAHPLFLLWHARTPFSLGSIYIPFTAPAERLLAGFGTIAFYLLAFVVVTSYFRANVGLRLWKQLHYVAYALLPVFLFHGLFVDPDLNERTPIDFIDAGKTIVEVCAVICLALIVWRISYQRKAWAMDRPKIDAVPISRPEAQASRWEGIMQILEVVPENATVKTFRLGTGSDQQVPFRFCAGQYLKIDGIRRYTISSSPEQSSFVDVTVKREQGGFFSNALHKSVDVGDRLHVRAPFGDFFVNGADHESTIVMIAGGVGITPFLSMIPHLLAQAPASKIILIHSVRTPSDLIRGDELQQWVAVHPAFDVHFIITETLPDDLSSIASQATRDMIADLARTPKFGRITQETIREIAPQIERSDVYLCGPVPMMQAVTRMLHSLGVQPHSIRFESFGEATISNDESALAGAH